VRRIVAALRALLSNPRAFRDACFQAGFALGALALGAHGLADKGLWVDEAVSLRFALQPPATWFDDNNMALFYALLAVVVRLFGDGESALRALSVACFAGALPLFYALLRRAFTARVARIGCAMFVSNAYLLHFAQEARGYMLCVLLVIGASLTLFCLVAAPSRVRALLYGTLIGLSLYAHAFALWILFAHGLAALALLLAGLRGPRELSVERDSEARTLRRELVLAFALATCFAAPLVLRALSAGTIQISWIKRPTLDSCLGLFVLFAGGNAFYALSLGALSTVFLVLCFVRLRAGTLRASFAHVLFATWFVVPLVATLGISRLLTPIAHPKYLLATLPALLAAAAVSVARLRSRLHLALAVLLLTGLSGFSVRDYYLHYQKEQWREVVAFLQQHLEPRDALVLDLSAPEPFDYYALRGARAETALLPPPLVPDRAYDILWGEVKPHDRGEVLARLASYERLWLVRNRSEDAALRADVLRMHRPVSRFIFEPRDGDDRSLFASSAGRIISVEAFVRADAPSPSPSRQVPAR
jgi:hypothetical protein